MLLLKLRRRKPKARTSEATKLQQHALTISKIQNSKLSLLVVGSVAFDAVETPFGKREKMLGGSASHFSISASFFTDVRVVAVVGGDFGAEERAVFAEHKIDTTDLEVVPDGKT